jgi:hypothetical protein
MAADIAVISVEKSHAVFINEATWATVPGSPTYVHVPVTSCNVRFKPTGRKNAMPRAGLFQRKHGNTPKGHPTGNIVCPLYGWWPAGAGMSAAQYMLEWGSLDHESIFPRSKILDWAVGPNTANRRHLGLRVNSLTLAGGDGGITLTLELIGQSSVALTTAQALPADRDKLVEFLFEDAVFTLDGNVTPIGSFEWKIARGLQPQYWNKHAPQSLPKSSWVETFNVTPPKTGHAWEDLRDALGMTEVAASLVLKGLHNGTGGSGDWTVLTQTFPRLSLIDVDEQESNGIYNEPLSFDVLKPDTSDLCSTSAWTEV